MQPIKIHNADRNVTAKDFKDAKQLYVSSAFLTIQGEGPFAGHPAVFLRLAGCNFGAKSATGMCSWCDTSFQLDKATKLTVAEVVNLISVLRGNRKNLILVITGGEPTLQPLVLDVLTELEWGDHAFDIYQFESNGTNPSFAKALRDMDEQVFTKISFGVSPKYNYRTKECKQLPSEVLALVEMTGFLKFVVSADDDNPHHEIPAWAMQVMRETMTPVYVSPMTIYKRSPEGEVSSVWDATLVDHEATRKNYEYAAQYVLKNSGLLLSLQTHLFTNLA